VRSRYEAVRPREVKQAAREGAHENQEQRGSLLVEPGRDEPVVERRQAPTDESGKLGHASSSYPGRGFGVQNRLVPARQEHAGYCARYISTRLAPVAPLRRAYGFSADFPKVSPAAVRDELVSRFGIEPEDPCDWHPRHELLA
jgi:hypothetical protein